MFIIENRGHRPRLQQEISSSDIFDFDPIRRRVTQTERTGKTDIIRHASDGGQTRPDPPLFQTFQGDGVQSHWIFARI